MWMALAVGLAQGLLHAVGPDHCAAMLTLGTHGGRRAALKGALGFAASHTVVLGGLAAFCLALGIGLSEAFERWAEVGGGIVLVGLAAAALFFPSALRHGHPHWSSHGKDSHAHVRLPMAAGALMAFSGIRSLLLAVPPLMVGGSFSLASWVFLPGFAAGVFAGMSVVGLFAAAGAQRLQARWTLRVQRLVAVSTAGMGVFWIASRW